MRALRWKKLALGTVFTALALALLYCSQVVLLPLALAAVLCYILLPLVRRLESWRLPKGLAASAAILIFFGGLVLLGFLGLPRLWRDLSAIGALAPQATLLLSAVSDGWQEHVAPAFTEGSLGMVFSGCFRRFSAWLGEAAALWLENNLQMLPRLFGSLSLLVFTPVFAFYLLRDRAQFAETLTDALPAGSLPLLKDLNRLLQSFVRGYFYVAVSVGLLFGLLLWLFGLNYSFTLGLLMLVAELIPYLGPFLAFFPCMALGLLQGRLAALKLLIIWAAVQQLESLVISPYIMSGAVRLHPFYVILAVLIGGFWWGVFGMILAVPLAAAIRTVWQALYRWWRNCETIQPEDWIL